MGDWLQGLPLILAGPILRRAQSDRLSVWIATSKPCSQVELAIWSGLVSTPAGGTLFSGPAPLFPPTTGRTLRIGANLHIAVITARNVTLFPGQLYSYNIKLDHPAGIADLNSEHLLEPSLDGQRPNLPLGYAELTLPGFALPPPELDQLNLVQGGCRKGGSKGLDALSFLDDILVTTRADPLARPHQLFLTGDQIYADEVPRPVLPLLTTIGHFLTTGAVPDAHAGDPDVHVRPGSYLTVDTIEHLPTNYPTVPSGRLAATHENYSSVWRQKLIEREGKLSTTEGRCHVLSFGEFAALYLFMHSNACWPYPSYPRRADADVPTWSPEPGLVVVQPTGPLAQDPGIPARRPSLPQVTAEDLRNAIESFRKDEIQPVEDLRNSLARIRRALANVPTYMVGDDHEVTDDWNITRKWVEDVYGTPLGRAVVRNGLVAYALFQAWGNDPDYFDDAATPGHRVLTLAGRMFAQGEIQPPIAQVTDELDVLFGLAGGPSLVRWDFTLEGPRHRVVALDVRTRRFFYGPTSPPANLPPTEIERQIPDPTLIPAKDVLILVTSMPTFGIPLRDDFVQMGYVRWLDFFYETKNDDERERERPGFLEKDFEQWHVDPPALEMLLERLAGYRRVVIFTGDVHHSTSSSMSYWRRGDATPARYAQFTGSSAKNQPVAMIVNTVRAVVIAEQAWQAFTPLERLGWRTEFPPTLTVPEDVKMPPALRHKLRSAPVLVPTIGWPPETVQEREPDWAWRLRVITDTRPPSEMPPAAREDELVADVDPIADGIAAYSAVARRHQRSFETLLNSRGVVFSHNLSVITFTHSPGLVARHSIYSLHARATPPDKPDVFTVHEVPLDHDEEDDAFPELRGVPL